VSVVTFPRRVDSRHSTRSAPRTRHRAPWTARFAIFRGRSLNTKVAVIGIAALVVVMAGNSYAAERQVEIHQQQTALMQVQAKYAAQIAQLTSWAAPARVAEQAGRLHLEIPTSVTQVSSVPLTRRLPTVQLRGAYVVQPRIYR
jgi:hypothetical protein